MPAAAERLYKPGHSALHLFATSLNLRYPPARFSPLYVEVALELQQQRQRGPGRDVDWFAAGVAGFVAGAVMMVLELFWAASMGDVGPWRVTQLTAALTMGSEATLNAPASQFNLAVVTVALATHYALGIFSGLVLAWILAAIHRFGRLGVAEAVGGAFGAVIYVVNFHILTVWAPWFAELRGWGTFILHLIFGLVAAVAYTWLSRRGQDARGSAGGA